jgi:apolipoprotein N-acyltransferase
VSQDFAIAARDGGVRRVRNWLTALGPRGAAFALFGAGGVSVLAFAPVFAWPVLFVTFPVLVWRLDASADPWTAAKAGWWFGFGYFFFGLFWVGEAFLVEAEKFAWALPLAVTLLPAGLALFWGAAAGLARVFWSDTASRLFVLAICLTMAEFLRGHVLTGFPWNLAGYALTGSDVMMQGAALFGAYGLTALALFVFVFPIPHAAGGTPTARRWLAAAAPPLAVLATLYAYGTARLSEVVPDVPGVSLRIVQPSVVQREKWMAEHQVRIFQDHLALSATGADGEPASLTSITHVLWPEAAMPFLPLEHPEALAAIAGLLPDGTSLMTGALRRETTDLNGNELPLDEHRVFNGMMVFDSDGRLSASYDKLHLVPFGEYLPLEPVLTALGLKKLTHGRGAFTAGVTPRPVLGIAGLPKALALVCYEALFPGAIVQGRERPRVLINVTNDGWFGNTSGPPQHFHQARVRAVEEGLPLLRAANNGISAIVDGHGRVRQSLALNVRGVIDGGLPGALAPTPYARYGDVPLILILVLYAAAAALLRQRGPASKAA